MAVSRHFFLWMVFFVSLYLFYLLIPVFTPFLIAALLAYLGDPFVDKMQAQGFSRTLSVITVFTALSAMMMMGLLLIVPMLIDQVMGLVEKLPVYLQWLQSVALPKLEKIFDFNLLNMDAASIGRTLKDSLNTVGGVTATILGSLGRSSAWVMSWMVNLTLIPVLTFYLLRDWDLLIVRIRHLLPHRAAPLICQLVKESDLMLGSFLRGQLTVMIALGLIYSIGLSIAGLEFSLLIGILAGLVSFVPYLGFIFGVLAAGIAAFLQFQDIAHLLPVLLVFGVGQVLESFVLTPLLVGDKLGMHPIAVMFALMAGGQLFGFFGILLALPVAAVIMVLLRHVHDVYMASPFYLTPKAKPDKPRRSQ